MFTQKVNAHTETNPFFWWWWGGGSNSSTGDCETQRGHYDIICSDHVTHRLMY